jgi:hypothetical protein
MADTQQIVFWTLAQRCLLRASEESVVDPFAAGQNVASATAYSRGLRARNHGFGVVGDVCVTSLTFASRLRDPKDGQEIWYPSSGFVVSSEFERFGGTEALFEMCRECPANLRPGEIAECVDFVYRRPDSPKTEAQLRGIISRLGLQSDVEVCFPKTTPLWYGLWANSPVPRNAMPVLKTLLSQMLMEDQRDMEADGRVSGDRLEQLSSLIAAIDRAETRDLQLHVAMHPLGHADLGDYTVFPHCPFCKANAQLPRWERQYPTQLHTCRVCGTRFSPAETSTVERMESDGPELREILGDEGFRRFARDYLVAYGKTSDAAKRIVEETEAEEIRRQEKRRRNEELEQRRDQFLEEHVFAGLDCMPAPPGECREEEEESRDSTDSTRWFDADNMAEVLRRCARMGIEVTTMLHESSDGRNDRFERGELVEPLELFGKFEWRGLKDPLELLEKWRSEGCDELFYADCQVPDSLLDRG